MTLSKRILELAFDNGITNIPVAATSEFLTCDILLEWIQKLRPHRQILLMSPDGYEDWNASIGKQGVNRTAETPMEALGHLLIAILKEEKQAREE